MYWQIERAPRDANIRRRTALGLLIAGTVTFALPNLGLAKPKSPGEPEPKPDNSGSVYTEIPLVLRNPETMAVAARMVIIHPQGLDHPENGSYKLDLEKGVLSGPPKPKALEFREHLDLLVQFDSTFAPYLGLVNILGSGDPSQGPSIWASMIEGPDFSLKHRVETSWRDFEINEVKWDGNPLSNLYPNKKARNELVHFASLT